MDTTIDQQVTMDEALVPHARRLRIGMSNFRLLSDIKPKECTLQLVYDVLRLSPFFKAFLVTAYVPEIYMQEFWATATVHHHSIRFKIDNKKHIVNMKSFREMLHIFLRLPHQPFVESSFKEEIITFLGQWSPRLTTSKTGKQAAKASKPKNEGTGSIPRVLDVPTDESEEEISWNSTDEEGNDDEGKDGDGDDEGNDS
nr:hypothetical protein [Tanacetum cinerariifolium]